MPLYRITAPHFTAGVEVGELQNQLLPVVYVVKEAAPIVSWMKDMTLPALEAYCQRKSWILELVPDGPAEAVVPKCEP